MGCSLRKVSTELKAFPTAYYTCYKLKAFPTACYTFYNWNDLYGRKSKDVFMQQAEAGTTFYLYILLQ